jgi:hypothetical protein
MVLESMLLGAASVIGFVLVVYYLAAFRARRAAQEQAFRTHLAAGEALQAAELLLRAAPASYQARGTEPGLGAVSRPMDAWVDDALRHRLDEL